MALYATRTEHGASVGNRRVFYESNFHQRRRPEGRRNPNRKRASCLLQTDRMRHDPVPRCRGESPAGLRFMISKKLCGVKISLCRERGFILHIIFIMIPTNLRYFCLATFSFLESPGIPDSLKYFFHRKIHFCILRCCVDICMPQPIRNRTQIVFCL